MNNSTMQHYYFAYGSNLNRLQMKDRCPDSSFIETAFLDGYRIVFDGRPGDDEEIVANIVPAEGGRVWGAVFKISGADLKNLDEYEDVANGYYERVNKPVSLKSGGTAETFVYLRSALREGRPDPNYLSTIIEGARQCDLPDGYVADFLTGVHL